jgi:hypothetical protein
MEEKEVVEDVHAKGDPENLPEGAIDLEVAKIASENLTTSNGLDVAEARGSLPMTLIRKGRRRCDFDHVDCGVM